MSEGGDLLLVRHGRTEWSETGRHTGLTDLPLTPRGEQRAAALAPYFAGRSFALVLASPLRRAAQTASLAGMSDVEYDQDLREWDYGAYEGLTSAAIERSRPGWSLWRDGVPAGPEDHPGESAGQVGRRVDRVLARVREAVAERSGDVVLFAHAHVLRVLTARYLQLPPTEGRLFRLDTGTVSRLSHEHGLPVVARWNVPTQ
ncbi:histidine phosphatase family protein [Streptomyces sp. NPDC046324]|uniref:histidine phosphatase family protein n=1 Tax=Streptomyces sp. NPDC046324 TaxID=3154915 RepID=UPI0033C5D805